MEGKNNQTKREITLDDLARIVQDNFLEIKSEFKTDFGKIKSDIREIKSNTENIKADLNKKVDRFEHKELEIRVEKVEEKIGLKQKLKFA